MSATCLPLPEQSVTMRLTIDSDSLSLVRHAVIAACGESVRFIRVQRVPRSTQVQIWLVLTESVAPHVMSATLKAVPYGEIGPVIQQQQNPESRRY
jgi:hypothetical protein